MARFLEDVNVPDGTVLVPQAQFLKIWKMVNHGDQPWPHGTALEFFKGQPMFNEALFKDEDGESPRFPVGRVEPGQSVCIAADLQAPSEPGRYMSYWRLMDPEGNRFGHVVWCDIIVEAADNLESSMSSSMIFPVINYQKSNRSDGQSIPVSAPTVTHSTETDNVDHDEDPFQDPPSREASVSTFTDLISEIPRMQPSEHEAPSMMSETESDAGSVTPSITSSNSGEFVVVEKYVDEDARSRADEGTRDIQSPVRPMVPETPIVHIQTDQAVEKTEEKVDDVDDPEEIYRTKLNILVEMGFRDLQLNRELLTAHQGKLEDVLACFLDS